jgi:hypothetical protein
VDTRQQRVARNEALFRQVNERIRQVNEPLDPDERTDFLCECGDDDCTAPVSLTLAEYEEIRSTPTHFVVAHGHGTIDVERVVEKNERYSVVEKFRGEAERVALETDPRP